MSATTLTNESNTDKLTLSTEATLSRLNNDKEYHNENEESVAKNNRKQNRLKTGSQNNAYRFLFSVDMKYKTNKTKVSHNNSDENNENQKQEKNQKNNHYKKSISNNDMNIDFNEKIG